MRLSRLRVPWLVGAAVFVPALVAGCGTGAEAGGSLITQRACAPQQTPRLVVLRTQPGTPALCFGGGIGALRIPETVVAAVESGGYTVCVGREPLSSCLVPGHTAKVDATITTVGNCPAGDWSGCLNRLSGTGALPTGR